MIGVPGSIFHHCHISRYNVTLPQHVNPNVNLVITRGARKRISPGEN